MSLLYECVGTKSCGLSPVLVKDQVTIISPKSIHRTADWPQESVPNSSLDCFYDWKFELRYVLYNSLHVL
jgi:hypothetical protein